MKPIYNISGLATFFSKGINLIVLLLLMCIAAIAQYNPHPRIMLTPSRIARIQAQHYAVNSYEWQQLINAGANRTDLDGARSKAFVYAITGDTAYANGALTILQNTMQTPMSVSFNTVGPRFLQMACIYDWLYNYPGFTPQLKQQMIAYVNAVPKEGSGKWNWYPRIVYMNGAAKPLHGVPAWGYATAGDNNMDTLYINNGYRDRWRYIRNAHGYANPKNQNVNRGGDQPKGWDYGSGYWLQITTYLDIVKTATNVDLFPEAPALKEFMEYFPKTFYHTSDYIRHSDHGHNAHRENSFLPQTLTALKVMMNAYDTTLQAHWAKWWFDNTPNARAIASEARYFGPEGVIFTNNNIAAQSYAAEPLNYYAEGNGMIYSRSNWCTGSQEPTTFSTFRAGNWVWFSQEHWDQGNYTLYSHGANLIPDCGTYDGNGGAPTHAYHHQTIAHNTILVKDSLQNKGWDHLHPDDSHPDWNTGGQSVPWSETLPTAVLDGQAKDPTVLCSQPELLHDASEITIQENNNRYTYAFADITNAYANPNWSNIYSTSRLNQVGFRPKVNNVTRQYMYMREQLGFSQEFIVTYDRVSSTDSNFQKTNLIHTTGEPVMSGSLVSTAVPGHVETYNSNSFVMKYGGAVLNGNIILPVNAVVKKVGGYGYEYFVNDSNYYPFANPADIHNHLDDAGIWRMEIMPPVKKKDDIFFNVLQPDYDQPASYPMATVTHISSALHEGAAFGKWIVMFSSEEKLRDTANYTVPVLSSCNKTHIICNMTPNYTYKIFCNGLLIDSVLVTANSIAEFNAATCGNFQVTRGSYVAPPPPVYATVIEQQANMGSIRNYPNPVRVGENTVISYTNTQSQVEIITISDATGRHIKTICSNTGCSQGSGKFVWDGTNDEGMPVSAGIYICKMSAGSYSQATKIILVN